MIYVTGWMWRLFGLHWSSLAPIFGVLYGASCLAAYGLCRLAMGRTLAVIGALAFAIVPAHLGMFPQERDYAKAPFILIVIFLLGLALRRREAWPWKQALALGAGIGLAAGLGIGWRQDVQVCLFPATVVLAAFLPGSLRATWKTRAGAVAVMLAVFTVTSWPILGAMARHGNYPAHDIFNGMSESCTLSAGYQDPGAQLQPLFQDHYTAQTIRAHARYALHAAEPVEYLSAEYNSAGMDLIRRYVLVFPFNQLLRGVASMRSILTTASIEFWQAGYPVPPLLDTLAQHTLLPWLQAGRVAIALLPAVLFVMACRNPRAALGMAFLILLFGMYPTLQYSSRHNFHLIFFVPWLILAAIQATLDAQRDRPRFSRQDLLRGGGVMAVIVGGFGALLGLAFGVQQVHATMVLKGMAQIPRQPLTVAPTKLDALGPQWTLLQPAGLFPDAFTDEDRAWQFVRRFVVVEFGPSPQPIPVNLHYTAAKFTGDYSYQTEVTLHGGNTTFYFPVYSIPDSVVRGAFNPGRCFFDGIAVPDAMLPLVRSVSVLEHEPFLPLYARLDEQATPAQNALAELIAYTPRGRLRMALAAGFNEFPYGDSETWTTDSQPVGFQLPAASSVIARETASAQEGHIAIRQTWQAPDAGVSPLQRFGISFPNAAASTSYDICVDAWNPGPGNVYVSAWLVNAPPGQSPQIASLAPMLFVVPPSKGYATYLGTVNLFDGMNRDIRLLVTPTAPEGTPPGQSVLWDHWRIGKSPRL